MSAVRAWSMSATARRSFAFTGVPTTSAVMRATVSGVIFAGACGVGFTMAMSPSGARQGGSSWAMSKTLTRAKSKRSGQSGVRALPVGRRAGTLSRICPHSEATAMLVGYVTDERYVALSDVAVVFENGSGMIA